MESKRITSYEDAKVVILSEALKEPTDTQIQVEARVSVVSPGTERAFILSMENTDRIYPRTLGYSMAGVVTKIGAAVTEFKAGDRVCGIMPHATIGVMEQKNAVHIPDAVSFEDAAFVRIGVISMQATRKARIELGESVMIFGLGLIGQVAAQLSKANGAGRVIGVDVVESKLRLAKENGCSSTLNFSSATLVEDIKAVNDSQMPQVVVESTGFGRPTEMAIEIVANYGRVIILGSARENSSINFYRDVHKKGIQIIGAHISTNPADHSYPTYWTFKDNARCFLQLIADGRMNVKSLVSQTAYFEEFSDIYENVLDSNPDYITSLINWKN